MDPTMFANLFPPGFMPNMVPGGSDSLGMMIAGQPAVPSGVPGTMLQGGVPATPPVAPAVAPLTAPPTMAGQPGGMNPAMLQALQAVQRPQATAPIMHGGVTGSQKAPEMAVHAGQQGQQLQALMQLLRGRPNPMIAPSLGQLIGR